MDTSSNFKELQAYMEPIHTTARLIGYEINTLGNITSYVLDGKSHEIYLKDDFVTGRPTLVVNGFGINYYGDQAPQRNKVTALKRIVEKL